MKKSIRNAFGLLLLMSAVTFVSCSSDDNSSDNNQEQPGTGSEFVANPQDFKGNIKSGKVTLDATKTYNLTGAITVENGATLIIPAGTKIIGSGGTSSYIAVAQGGKIEVNGTATNPVVMTSSSTTPGSWGGLVICGKAPINKAIPSQAEVTGLAYGGNDANDNSGSIKYLRIEYAGANFSSEKEFNGLSLFGVGKGTKIEYVQIFNCSDDGIEFFGGTVDTKYIVSTGSEDDSFDWTEGWNGTNEYWFGQQRADIGNRGVEADNNSSNHTAAPISNPVISNVTLIGRGEGSEPDAFKLRVGTLATINNVVLKDFSVGFNVEHDESIAGIENGTLKITNVKFENIATKSKGKNTAGTSVDVSGVYTESASATGAGNGSSLPTWAQGWTVGL